MGNGEYVWFDEYDGSPWNTDSGFGCQLRFRGGGIRSAKPNNNHSDTARFDCAADCVGVRLSASHRGDWDCGDWGSGGTVVQWSPGRRFNGIADQLGGVPITYASRFGVSRGDGRDSWRCSTDAILGSGRVRRESDAYDAGDGDGNCIGNARVHEY